MIYGIGVDIASVAEMRRVLADPATHFLGAHFTTGELAYARVQASGDPARHLAARYAVKEAVVKAIGGMRDAGRRTQGAGRKVPPIDYRQIEVVTTSDGAPGLRFHGAVAESARAAGIMRTHVSLSHDGEMAIAMVVMER